jgi:hypothetical protein
MALNHRRGAHSAGPSGERIICGWDDCQRPGLEMYKIRVNNAADARSSAYTVNHLFCSQSHLDYWRNGHRSYGNLPPGSR